MSDPDIDVVIDRLVVDGVAPGDGRALARAVERELARRLAVEGPVSLPKWGHSVGRLDAGAIAVSPEAGADTFGKAVATRIAGGLKR